MLVGREQYCFTAVQFEIPSLFPNVWADHDEMGLAEQLWRERCIVKTYGLNFYLCAPRGPEHQSLPLKITLHILPFFSSSYCKHTLRDHKRLD